ncbi:TetR/AcrR family transcriptional regulator [Streptomyces profundus]|uniref:TetR/AcrR family transcriptional regulator n=1 Tax=Streptomyces profundus TaxID=2867410 RepID=UPI001D16C057|nr:TetR/AcrR family transcriptional regulator [Streptomyces sp. MA3_2.13]UED83767.1 TetR/AcrR family transcriptional regulator [Streptomyces sp. MA3_2.13]
MPQRRGDRRRLTAADWADAALEALRDEGSLNAIAIEPLAARLGATKGSFYWHFASRDALIDAALAEWEARSARELSQTLDTDGIEPAGRVRELLRTITERATLDRSEVALLAAADQPRVAAVLERVIALRLDALTGLLRSALNLSDEDARLRASRAYCGQLGRAQLARAIPGVLPDAVLDEDRCLDSELASLLGAGTGRGED